MINIEPLHMGGILGSRKVADGDSSLSGAWISHAAQGPICTLACLHIDIATPNSWLQETFEDFNEPWERDLLTRFPASLTNLNSQGPGIGADLNLDVRRRHPYHDRPDMFLFEEDWHLRRARK